MPIGILGSLVICTILYVLFAHVLTGIVSYQEFKGAAAPVALAGGVHQAQAVRRGRRMGKRWRLFRGATMRRAICIGSN